MSEVPDPNARYNDQTERAPGMLSPKNPDKFNLNLKSAESLPDNLVKKISAVKKSTGIDEDIIKEFGLHGLERAYANSSPTYKKEVSRKARVIQECDKWENYLSNFETIESQRQDMLDREQKARDGLQSMHESGGISPKNEKIIIQAIDQQRQERLEFESQYLPSEIYIGVTSVSNEISAGQQYNDTLAPELTDYAKRKIEELREKRKFDSLPQEAKDKISQLTAENAELKQENTALKDENAELKAQIEAAQKDREELQSQLEAIQKENESLKKTVEEQDQKVADLQGQLQEANEEKDKAIEKLREKTAEFWREQRDREQAEERINELEEQLTNSNQAHTETQQQLEDEQNRSLRSIIAERVIDSISNSTEQLIDYVRNNRTAISGATIGAILRVAIPSFMHWSVGSTEGQYWITDAVMTASGLTMLNIDRIANRAETLSPRVAALLRNRAVRASSHFIGSALTAGGVVGLGSDIISAFSPHTTEASSTAQTTSTPKIEATKLPDSQHLNEKIINLENITAQTTPKPEVFNNVSFPGTEAKISGNIFENLTYNDKPWHLLENSIKHISELGNGNIDSDELKKALQKALEIRTNGGDQALSQNPALYKLFHLGNGTSSLFESLSRTNSAETIQSLRELGIIK